MAGVHSLKKLAVLTDEDALVARHGVCVDDVGVLDPAQLYPEYRDRRYQLWTILQRTNDRVYCRSIYDGSEDNFDVSDFIGRARDADVAAVLATRGRRSKGFKLCS